MKKTNRIISVIICLTFMFSLSACGKSEEVVAVENLITAIGAVSLNSEEAIIKAEQAYNELTTEDKEKVSNYTDLETAKEEYFNIAYSDYVAQVNHWNDYCNVAITTTLLAHDSIYAMYVKVGDGYTYDTFAKAYFTSISLIKDEESAKQLKNLGSDDYYLYLLGAATAFDICNNTADLRNSDTENDVISACIAYNTAISTIVSAKEILPSEINSFISMYEGTHTKELEVLYNWCIETCLLVDIATTPHVILSYTSDISEYTSNINRYQIEAESYIK